MTGIILPPHPRHLWGGGWGWCERWQAVAAMLLVPAVCCVCVRVCACGYIHKHTHAHTHTHTLSLSLSHTLSLSLSHTHLCIRLSCRQRAGVTARMTLSLSPSRGPVLPRQHTTTTTRCGLRAFTFDQHTYIRFNVTDVTAKTDTVCTQKTTVSVFACIRL